jgi:hypothetical protein
MSPMFPPKHLVALMDRQSGLFTRKQACAGACDLDALDSAVRRRQLEIACEGVYRAAGSAITPEQRLLAAVFRCGDDARISGWSASALYGLEGMTFDQRHGSLCRLRDVFGERTSWCSVARWRVGRPRPCVACRPSRQRERRARQAPRSRDDPPVVQQRAARPGR